jgi:hypothetical protein
MFREFLAIAADVLTIIIGLITLIREVGRAWRRMRQESKKRQSGD